MPTGSLRTRLALSFAAVAALVAALMGAMSFNATRDRLDATTDASLAAAARPLADELRRLDGVVPRQPRASASAAAGTGASPAPAEESGTTRPAGIGAAPTLTASSSASSVFAGRDNDRPPRDGTGPGRGLLAASPHQVLVPPASVVVQGSVQLPADGEDWRIATADDPLVRYRTVSIDGEHFRLVTLGAGDGAGAAQVARSLEESDAVLAGLVARLAGLGLLIATVAAGAGWWLARRIALRLETLTAAATEVAATGRLDVEVPEQGRDEVARLGTSFNAMVLRLAQAKQDQQRLIQDAGHELRTPLTSLRTNISLLRRFDDMPRPTRARVLADLASETRELTDLVNEVVVLASETADEAPRGPVRLAEVATSVANRARRRTGRPVVVDADDSVVIAQRSLLERAVWNLVDNAIKFSTPDGPPVAGALESLVAEPVSIVIRKGRVDVRDRGPGLAGADPERLFDRFYRADAARSRTGSGLGLAIVRDVATSCHGVTFAADRPGGGATIGMVLPLAPEGVE